MDEDVVVQVENVSKVYQLYDKPQDRLKQALFWRFGKRYGREFWALRDVSFQVRRGETVGIIGRNGSGKSTLLQIIAGTLQPTSGSVQVRGRVAALLELGSGFNPEFTGRENVYMAGSLLGLSDAEVASHFDAIEKFAEIGDFIDQPVKLYSSGMFVRLAFSMQTVLKPDVLIVDEALSVGDSYFVQKCIRWIHKFRNDGGSILFVSHDLLNVRNLSNFLLWLEHGKSRFFTEVKQGADLYSAAVALELQQQKVEMVDINKSDPVRFGNKAAKILSANITDCNGKKSSDFEQGCDVVLNVEYELFSVDRPMVGYLWRDRLGRGIFGASTQDYTDLENDRGKYRVSFKFRVPFIAPGTYFCSIAVQSGYRGSQVVCDWIDEMLSITVIQKEHVYGIVFVPNVVESEVL